MRFATGTSIRAPNMFWAIFSFEILMSAGVTVSALAPRRTRVEHFNRSRAVSPVIGSVVPSLPAAPGTKRSVSGPPSKLADSPRRSGDRQRQPWHVLGTVGRCAGKLLQRLI